MSKFTRKQFIEAVAPYAIADMKKTGVPASLTIAQAILESADGNSTLAIQANNLFGMKGKGTAGSVRLPTKEFRNGEWITIQADFRKYHNWGESIKDHSDLFLNGVSWNRNLYRGVIGTDGITASREVAKAGYATDPNYADKLIMIISAHDLLQYDSEPTNNDTDIIQRLTGIVDNLNKRLSEVEQQLEEVPAPEWFVNEFPEALNLIHQKTGSRDFWRAFAVVMRVVSTYQKPTI